MKELSPDQKQSIWTKLGKLVGLADSIKLKAYQTTDGQTIEVDDETGEVKGSVADGEYPLEDGKILAVTEGKAEEKAAPEAEQVEQTAEDQPTDEAQGSPELEAALAENEALKAKVAELEAALAEATKSKDELATQLSKIEAEPADKKITLAAQSTPASKTPGQLAWERYNSK